MSKETILIVEDEAIVAADLSSMLGRLGYKICGTTPRGEDAIDLARELRPDLVLMDIRLAGAMDGVEAAEIIHRESGLPVIFLTAHSDHATLERAKRSEPFGYLLKPFEELGLETHIEMALFKHRAELKLRQAHDELERHVEERTRELREAEQGLREINETLERRVSERTAELQAANATLQGSRRAALNMMEDAVAARRQAEEVSAELQREVTERRRVELEREHTIEFLRLVNESSSTKGLIEAATFFFQDKSGCEAIGIRLQEGDDFPYYETHGFPREFVQMENALCSRDRAGEVIRDCEGNPVIECMCGNVIRGRFDPAKQFFTAKGSFWSNGTTELLATTSEADRQARTRNRCNGDGYESVALIPLRLGEKSLGLLQLNDRQKGRFTPELITLWERLADNLVVALAKFRAEEALQKTSERTIILAETASSLLESNSPQEAVETICLKVMEFLDCHAFFNFLVDKEAGQHRLNACAGIPEEDREKIDGFDHDAASCGCAAGQRCRILTRKTSDPLIQQVKSYGIKAYACHPLAVQGRVLGTLSFGTRNRTSFSSDDLALMKAVADQIAIAMVRKSYEEDLRLSKEKWERTFNSVPDLIAIIDDRHRVAHVNKAMADRLGRTPEECVGIPCHEAVHGSNLPHDFCPHSKTMNDGGEHNVELYEERLGGDFLVTTTPLLDSQGRMTGTVHVARDITERKQAEEALRRAHDELEIRVGERTKELADTVDILLEQIIVRERMEASLLRLNRLYAVQGETAQAIIRDTNRDALFQDFCRIAVEEGNFLLSWVGVVDEESGQLRIMASCGATGYLDDIRVSVKEEPVGEGPTGISIRQGTYYICNDFLNDPCTNPWQEQGRAHGIKASASVALKEEGRVIGALTLYAGEQDFFDKQQVELLVQMGADVSFALDNIVRETRRHETERALLEESAERIRVVEDLREKEQMLIQQSRQAAMGEMINNIAHQWRQPLNTLGLMVQQLSLYYDLGKINREFLDNNIEKSMGLIKYMSKTIDDFRNYFKPDKEKIRFQVNEAIVSTLTLLEGSLHSPKIGIEIVEKNKPVIVGYQNEFAQVILNILINARDALIERKISDPKVTVTISSEDRGVVITVTDNAGGISDEIIGKIFDPYFTTKGPQQGTGVGLFMSKTIIEKNMGGRLSVRNRPDGAEFRIEVAYECSN